MRTILLVEDTPGDVAQLQRAARLAGLAVRLEVVGDGAEAMVYLSGRGDYTDRECHPFPDLLLLDLAMPRRSGIEVLAWMQGQPQLERLPVVVLTASRDREDIALAFELGASSYLVKPVAAEALADVVNAHLLPLGHPLTVLAVADTVHESEQILGELRLEFPDLRARVVAAAGEMIAAVDAGGFDVVVTTWSSAAGTGIDVLRAVKARWPDCPVVMLAGSLGAKDLQEALRSGLDDCVLDSPEHILRLPAAVRLAVGRSLQRRALRAAEARYRTLVEQIPAITYTASLETIGHMVFVSPQVERLGFTVEEVEADPGLFVRLIHPDDRDEVLAASLRCRESSEPVRLEYRLLTRGGRELWFRDEATVVRDEDGRAVCLHGVLLDITERKRAEGMARTSAERFRAVASLAPAGIFLADGEGNCFWVNERWCELTGMGAEEAALTGWIKAVHADDRDRVLLEWYGAAAEGRDFASEYRLQTRDAKERWVAGRGKAVRHSDGTLAGIVGAVLEIAGPHRVFGS